MASLGDCKPLYESVSPDTQIFSNDDWRRICKLKLEDGDPKNFHKFQKLKVRKQRSFVTFGFNFQPPEVEFEVHPYEITASGGGLLQFTLRNIARLSGGEALYYHFSNNGFAVGSERTLNLRLDDATEQSDGPFANKVTTCGEFKRV
ncbi:hypothetical protein Tco_1243050 [Tanacetum coccineum]